MALEITLYDGAKGLTVENILSAKNEKLAAAIETEDTRMVCYYGDWDCEEARSPRALLSARPIPVDSSGDCRPRLRSTHTPHRPLRPNPNWVLAPHVIDIHAVAIDKLPSRSK